MSEKQSKIARQQSNLHNQPHSGNPSISQEKQLLAYQEHYSGPMPPPLWLKQYEEIYPGFTNRCFDQQEQESVNRRKIEGDYSSGFKWAALMSIAGAIIAILTLIAFAFYALSLGQVILAGSTITVGVVAFAAVLLYRRTRPHQKTKAGKDQD